MTPFCAARMISGSASFRAASARLRSPAAIASSILPTALRRRERRDLLISVRRAIWRVALRADDVLAMRSLGILERGGGHGTEPAPISRAYRGGPQASQSAVAATFSAQTAS